MSLDNIERIATPEPDDFFHRHVLPGRPVVLRDLAAGAAIAAIDSAAAARSQLGALELEVQPNYMCFLRTGCRAAPRRTTLAAYLDAAARRPGSDDLCVEYPTPPRLLQRFSPRPALCLLRDPDDLVSHTFVANRGNYNHLHFDDDQRDVLLYQVFGRKRVVVLDPGRGRLLDAFVLGDPAALGAVAGTPARDANGRVYLEQLDEADKRAFLAYAGALDTVLAPGETLYMPMLCWHYVEYLDTGMSVSFRLGRSRYHRLFASAVPRPDIVVQRVAHALRDTARAERECPDVLAALAATCAAGDEAAVARAFAWAHDRLFAEPAWAIEAVRALYRRNLAAALQVRPAPGPEVSP
jgi:lysine-specific demethylase 8